MKDIPGKYKPDQGELRGRKKDKVVKRLTESRVRKQNKVDPKQDFDG